MKLNLVQKPKRRLQLKRIETNQKQRGSKYVALQNKMA